MLLIRDIFAPRRARHRHYRQLRGRTNADDDKYTYYRQVIGEPKLRAPAFRLRQ